MHFVFTIATIFACESRQQYRFMHKCNSTLNTLSSIANQSASSPVPMRFYSKYIKLTVIHIYAPTEDKDEKIKDDFYASLQDVLDKRNAHDMLIVIGDMNAKVGNQNENYERVMGKHGLGERNNNGERLCEICDMNELVITGTLFPHKNIHKATWVSPDGKTRNQIDHVLISKRFRNSVRDTRVYRSADLGSDHHLVCTTIKLRLRRPRGRRNARRVKYETSRLGNEDVLRAFNITLRNRYQALEEDELENDYNEVERDFEVLRKAYTETAETVLGKPRKKKKPWISEESWQLVDQREEINKRILSTRSGRVKQQLRTKYVEKDREVKRSMKADKRRWLDNIANQAEEAAQSRHMKTLYGLTKTVCNERPKQCTAVMDKDGNILSRKKDIQDRWTQHF